MDCPVQWTPLHSTPHDLGRLGCGESPLESSGVHMEYGGDRKDLDDYIDEFQDLITESGYTDPKTIVVKFRRGLNPQIQNAVATMASGRPSDTDPSRWYEVARMVDQNKATNEAFQS